MATLPVEPSRATLSFDEVAEYVRSALNHLYDYAFLQNHPLALLLDGHANIDGVTRAQRVRRLLLDCIEQLRPEDVRGSEETRAYAILAYRCVDGLSMTEIADKLALSRRQIYREYTRGVDAVASLAAERLQAPLASPNQSPTQSTQVGGRMVVATEEVERLKETLSMEPVSVPAVVHGVHALLAPRLARTAIHFTIDDSVELPQSLVDRAMLRQAFVNLFSYALDVIPANGELHVCFAQSDLAIQMVATGRIAEHPSGLTFHPRHREGVGLAVATQLIEANGGVMTIREAAGEWICVVELPTAKSSTVLVIDDNADLTMLFQRFLAGHNLAMVGAANGKQALELAHEVKPALILLDLMLPHQDGWEILQQLRNNEQTAATPIIICSVLNEPDLALAMGADDYITKPVSQETLVAVLRRWLGTLHPAV